MKKPATTNALAAWVLAGCCAQALAGQEVSVGRVDVQLPGDGWQVHSIEDKGITIAGDGHSHQQDTDYKVMVRRGADQVLDAAVVVRANVSGKGRFSGLMFTYAECKGSTGVYTEGGPSSRSFQCLRVAMPGTISTPADFPDEIRKVLTTLGWRLPPVMFAVSAQQHATTGAFAVVVAYMRPLASAPDANNAQSRSDALPVGVSPASVQWGQQLQQAVTDSVYSIRGKLAVPAMVFGDEAKAFPSTPAEAGPQVEPAREPAPPMAERG